MNKREHRFWIIGGVVELVGLLLSGFGLLPRQGGDLYKDPQGRFSMHVGFARTVLALEPLLKE